jgi:hypothetical protein
MAMSQQWQQAPANAEQLPPTNYSNSAPEVSEDELWYTIPPQYQ